MTARKTHVAMLVQTENVHDIRRITADFVRPQTNGELWAIRYERFSVEADVRALADFRVTAYVGDRESGFGPYTNGRVWGTDYGYENVHRIDSAQQARDMANLMGRVQRGLTRLNESAGFIDSDDFTSLTVRVATVVGVKDFYVRTLRSGYEPERYTKVTATYLQSHVMQVSMHVDRKEYHMLNERNWRD